MYNSLSPASKIHEEFSILHEKYYREETHPGGGNSRVLDADPEEIIKVYTAYYFLPHMNGNPFKSNQNVQNVRKEMNRFIRPLLPNGLVVNYYNTHWYNIEQEIKIGTKKLEPFYIYLILEFWYAIREPWWWNIRPSSTRSLYLKTTTDQNLEVPVILKCS